MKYLLDTHVWIWLLDDPGQLSKAAARAINSKSTGACGVSDISAWEVARKESLGKLILSLSSRVWLRKACAAPGIEMIGWTRRSPGNHVIFRAGFTVIQPIRSSWPPGVCAG